MNWTALWVVAGGAALAVGVNLYFFSPRRERIVTPPLAPRAASEPVTPPVTPEAGEADGGSPVARASAAPEHAEPPPDAASAEDAAP